MVGSLLVAGAENDEHSELKTNLNILKQVIDQVLSHFSTRIFFKANKTLFLGACENLAENGFTVKLINSMFLNSFVQQRGR